MTVSILIPTLDRPLKLERAVCAALAQTYTDIEVVVQDGGNGDSPPPRLPWDDPRLDYAWESDLGIADALNRAARRATGNILHFACDDDTMRLDTVANAIEAFDAGYEWTAGRIQVVDRSRRRRIELHGGSPWSVDTMMEANVIPQPATFFTRKIYEEADGFDESLALCVDYECWGRFGKDYQPLIRRHIDADYHRWSGSLSVKATQKLADEADLIRGRWREHGFGWRPT